MLTAIKNAIRKALSSSAQIDGNKNYNVQIKSYNSPLKSEVLYPYGYAANAPLGSLALTFTVANQPENLTSILYHPSTRFKGLAPNEVMVGNQQTQTFIKFLNSGDVEIKTNGTCMVIGNHTVSENQTIDKNQTVNGNVLIKGNLVVDGDITALNGSSPLTLSTFRGTYNSHTHPDPQGGNTGAPNQPI